MPSYSLNLSSWIHYSVLFSARFIFIFSLGKYLVHLVCLCALFHLKKLVWPFYINKNNVDMFCCCFCIVIVLELQGCVIAGMWINAVWSTNKLAQCEAYDKKEPHKQLTRLGWHLQVCLNF